MCRVIQLEVARGYRTIVEQLRKGSPRSREGVEFTVRAVGLVDRVLGRWPTLAASCEIHMIRRLQTDVETEFGSSYMVMMEIDWNRHTALVEVFTLAPGAHITSVRYHWHN